MREQKERREKEAVAAAAAAVTARHAASPQSSPPTKSVRAATVTVLVHTCDAYSHLWEGWCFHFARNW
jgi:hypothetical protein